VVRQIEDTKKAGLQTSLFCNRNLLVTPCPAKVIELPLFAAPTHKNDNNKNISAYE